MTEYILADDYITDRSDCSKGILRAVGAAVEKGIGEVRFLEGSYQLKDFTVIDTLSIAHDDGCGDIHTKECHLYLEQVHGLTLKGAIDPDGEPATRFAGCHQLLTEGEPKVQFLLPSIIWAKDCSHLTIENIALSREPETASSGVITDIREDLVEVEVFDGLPCYDGMAAYCMNRFDLGSGSLTGSSVTYGFGFDTRFHKTGERTLQIRSRLIASQVQTGEGLSWHQSGRTDFQLFFGGCTDLTFKNVRIRNTSGFGILTENCQNIMADKLVIKPAGRQLFAGPRDGWKVYRCTGMVKLQDCHIEGVRMDGQNVHTNFLTVEEIRGQRALLCSCKYAPIPLSTGTELLYYRGAEEQRLQLKAWSIAGSSWEDGVQSADPSAGKAVGNTNRVTRYLLELECELPDELKPGALLDALCWLPTEYQCISSTFRNIAGAGHLLRCRNVMIKDCTYENIMNAGILIGAELDTHREGGHGANITIEGCWFVNCGFKPRYGFCGMGGVAVRSQGFDAPVNHDIRICNNHFLNCDKGIEIRTVRDIQIENNRFSRVRKPIDTDIGLT